MKKIYTKKVTQYSVDGEYIQHFNNVNIASNIVNIGYDSIISCCRGKYKTAGGYIWRFENEPVFNDAGKKSNAVCGICNSKETIRSMAMHLKWAHNLKTDDYVKKYGEFRPKNIQNQSKQKTSQIKCKICNQSLNSNQHLMYHISISHPEITKSEYIIKHELNGITPTCKCGCGAEVTILENGKNCDLNKDTYHRDYIKGHWDWEVFTTIGKQSKEEQELEKYIKEIYHGVVESNVRKLIPKGEIDIYFPDLKIGIEYNGLYWHSEKNGKYNDYHINKTNECKKQGIRLIQIFSDEWLNKKDIVKKKLKSILCKEKEEKIYARKCVVKEITSREKNVFLNTHHIQGEDRSSIKLGLYYNDILTAVMTFSNPRISLGQKQSQNGVYELSRFASSQYVVGGSAKLIKHFTKHYSPNKIYSYSDNRWTDPNNNMYLKLGFKKVSSSSPGYFYTKDFLSRIHRYNFNKGALKKLGANMSKTEKEIMGELGYSRIWDCGSTKYEI